MNNKNKYPILNEEDLIISGFQPADCFDSDDYDVAEQALNHYKETGLYLTHEEVSDWLTSYKTGNIPKVIPECHK